MTLYHNYTYSNSMSALWFHRWYIINLFSNAFLFIIINYYKNTENKNKHTLTHVHDFMYLLFLVS